jgi:phosphoribulokinase
MRPTLPHPDLSPMLGTDSVDGLSFTLARDDDGKPVDLLTIGRIGDDAAQRLEELLWDHIPEASHLQQNVGRFTTSENTKATSHPLALTQLIITYHMVKAALGVHAV